MAIGYTSATEDINTGCGMEAMPHLIIGHTTDTTARIWLQGDRRSTRCTVTLTWVKPGHAGLTRAAEMNRDADYTGVVDFDELAPDTDYEVCATFKPSHLAVPGRLRTHRTTGDKPDSFSFVLSSCNLSIVSITDLLAFMVGMAGTQAARTSLDLPSRRWIGPPRLLAWLKPLLRVLGKALVLVAAWIVAKTTNVKQPAVRYLRSPFLKLSSIFESTIVMTVNLGPPPAHPEYGFLQVGDEVRAGPPDAADEYLSSAPGGTITSLSEIQIVNPSAPTTSDRVRRVVLTKATSPIAHGLTLFRQRTKSRDQTEWRAVGRIETVATGAPWLSPPSFFLHAGDQIYYDFPKPDRAPDRHEYHRAYREAWFEDEPLRHLLAHWPHYMTLDDHEVADQFARDFIPPQKVSTGPDGKSVTESVARPEHYLREATAAYRDYVHALAPREFQQRPATGPFWYEFEKGRAGFFVLDTRTKRRVTTGSDDGSGEMIDGGQLRELLAWLELPNKPKFIVTSVPFVAELTHPDPEEEIKREWFREAGNDKWCSRVFKKQRDAIIETIAKHRIEGVVFLTGDMHCCYHATMRIAVEDGPRAKPKKYESITVHELAGGPVNQLQLSRIDEFHRRRTGRTGTVPKGFAYEVRLEQFHGDVAAVMHIAVDYRRRRDMPAQAQPEPELVWNVIRTLTDPGPDAWPKEPTTSAVHWGPNPEPVMSGRIAFTRRRTVGELQPW